MRLLCLILWAIFAAFPAQAQGEGAGRFDYYVLSLGWSSNWCALTGDNRGDPQCAAGRGLTFTLHGLWPQFEVGYPSDCRTEEADPSRSDTAAMADIMGGSGVAFHEWQKHGRCSGLSAQDYYATMRKAYAAVAIPPLFAKVSRNLRLPALVVQDAFLDSNPGLAADQVTVTCTSGVIQEVRICLTRDLAPRNCAADVVRDCTLSEAELDAVR